MPKNITNKVYTIRGQKVMLDYDLAELYGYTTKAFNQQVKNNMEKFEGEEFMFQLTKLELDSLRSKNLTLNAENNLKSKNLISSSEAENLKSQNVNPGASRTEGSTPNFDNKTGVIAQKW